MFVNSYKIYIYLRRCETLWSAREIASMAPSAEQATHAENVFHTALRYIYHIIIKSYADRICVQWTLAFHVTRYTGKVWKLMNWDFAINEGIVSIAAMSAREIAEFFWTTFRPVSDKVIKIVRWFKLINSSNHLTIFLVEFCRKLIEKLSKKIVRLCRPFIWS